MKCCLALKHTIYILYPYKFRHKYNKILSKLELKIDLRTRCHSTVQAHPSLAPGCLINKIGNIQIEFVFFFVFFKI